MVGLSMFPHNSRRGQQSVDIRLPFFDGLAWRFIPSSLKRVSKREVSPKLVVIQVTAALCTPPNEPLVMAYVRGSVAS